MTILIDGIRKSLDAEIVAITEEEVTEQGLADPPPGFHLAGTEIGYDVRFLNAYGKPFEIYTDDLAQFRRPVRQACTEFKRSLRSA